MTLSEYLRQRGLNLDPTKVDYDPILAEEGALREAAEVWGGHQALITLAIQARINAISKEILEKIAPEEVFVYRQALVEVGALITDFQKYAAEYDRRSKPRNNTTETDNASPPKDEETTL